MYTLIRSAALRSIGVVALAWPGLSVAVPSLPVDSKIDAPLSGEAPTIGRAALSPNEPLAVVFHEASGDLWRWEPLTHTSHALGNPLGHCSAGADWAACGDPIQTYYIDLDFFYTPALAASGQFPSIDKDGRAIAWEEHGVSPDTAIGWTNPWVGGISYFEASNGLNEQRPVADGSDVVYQVFNAATFLDVVRFDTLSGTISWTAPNFGDETAPDSRYGYITWQSSGYPGGMAWRDRTTGTISAVPTPGTCAWGYGAPRLGGNGKWVVYQGFNCAGGGSELYLADMECGALFDVDPVLTAGSVPNYDILGDRLVYARPSGQIVYIDVNEHLTCGSLPGSPVPTYTTRQAHRRADNIAFAYGQTVVFSDETDTWSWEPNVGSLAISANTPYYGIDGWADYAIAEMNDEIFLFDIVSGTWSWVAKGLNPTISEYASHMAWEDSGAGDAISGWIQSSGTWVTELAGNGLREQNPALYAEFFAYEFDKGGGNWDVAVHNLEKDVPVASIPDKGVERNPDIWDTFVAFDLDSRDIVRYDYRTGAYEFAQLPRGCSEFKRPLLGNGGDFVIFAAMNCTDGNQLWLYDYSKNALWFVGYLGAWGDHSYHVVENKVVYIDDSQEAEYLEVQ